MAQAKSTKTFTALVASDNITRCFYLFPSGIQCFRLGQWKVVDSVLGITYTTCNQHVNVLKAIDGGSITGSGTQKNDQVPPAAVGDVGGETELSKDTRVRRYTGCTTNEVQPSS